jgi:hypothetical protein
MVIDCGGKTVNEDVGKRFVKEDGGASFSFQFHGRGRSDCEAQIRKPDHHRYQNKNIPNSTLLIHSTNFLTAHCDMLL